MRRRALRSLLLAVVMVVCVVGMGSATQPSGLGAPDRAGTQQHAANTAQQKIRITVLQNGSGLVTVHYRISLTETNERAAFERLRANITANPAWYRTRFGTRMHRVVQSAQVATGRRMAIANLTINATHHENTGIVTYSFVWTHIAATDGNRLRVGDALAGFYLENGTQLVIAWPDGYEPTTVRPAPDERQMSSVQWNAPTTFAANEPFVELAPVSSSPNDSNPVGGSGASGGTDNTADSTPTLLIVLVVVFGALGVVAWIAYRRRRDERDQTIDEQAVERSDVDSGDTGAPPTATDESKADLLSNEERVVRVLERAGGRAKQQHVVEELGWTEAKTSQVVKRLREEGTIDGFRLGRENVLTIPEDDEDHTD
ncbi:MAG TPA: hypothetical protein VFJ06_13620 [Halococcus sp.]|nr:hypothetical protein [Halococcus sp.]